MYSLLSSATHHIFFPPRLQAVVEEQNPDGFSSHPWHQFPLDRFLRYQSHRPSGATCRRMAANHGDDALLLAVLQQGSRSGPILFIECPFQPPFLVAVADLPNRLGSQRDNVGNAWGANTLGELQERRGAQHDSHRLYAAAQQFSDILLVPRGGINMQG